MNIIVRATLIAWLFAGPLVAQERSTADNPLAILKDEVKRVLEEAQLPFTNEQERAVILMMEERRRASEDLFGGLMDFRAGPTQGQEADRLRSAIEWMRNEFLTRLQNYLSEEQLVAWKRYQEAAERSRSNAEASGPQRRSNSGEETQYVRINNNVFTAEENSYEFRRVAQPREGTDVIQRRGGTEVIQRREGTEVIRRGGGGGFHGNAQFLLKDESLNAGRRSYNLGQRIPTVKPPYQERQTSFNLSGPAVAGRLTLSLAGNQNEAENLDTINATLADGTPFSREIVRPTINRFFSTGAVYQITNRHSLSYNVGYAPYSRKNQGIGGFVLPERASSTRGNDWNFELRQFSSLSPQSIYETRFNFIRGHEETTPAIDAVRINVLDTFSSGGAQNKSESTGGTYSFSNMYTRLGERLTIKTGTEGAFRRNRSYSTANFGGTFTFSSPEAFRAAQPLNYRVSRGEPLLETSQLELSFFMQNDLKLTPRLTAMFGLRYDVQTNVKDHDNFGPRLAFAYALSQGTVLRAGGGFFFNRVPISLIETQKRLDGTRQFELVIDNGSYPDPFQAGTIRNVPRSIRVTDPDLSVPYLGVGMISLERTFLTNLFVSATYDFQHEIHRSRLRNINAPFDATASFPRSCIPGQDPRTCIRPDPTRGQVFNLESTGGQLGHTVRLNFRKRFSIFIASADYWFQKLWSDTQGNATELAADNYNLRAEWSRANRAPVHTLSNTVNARLPFGVFLTGIVSANTGRSYTITTGRDDNMDGFATDRPPGHPRHSGDGQKFLAFNFNISKAFFFGDAGTNGTRTNLNVFANMTNAFNRANYGQPSSVMTSPNFGRSTSALDPREIEVGMRFQF